jgi:hypothetical protein
MAQAALVVQRSTDFAGEPSVLRQSDTFGGTYTVMVNLGAPAATATTGIGASTPANQASNTITISAQPDVPRVMQAAFAASWDGGNVVVTGYDQFGNPQTDTIVAAAGSTVVGVKAFKTITGLAKTAVGATANAVTVGPGSKLGLPFVFSGPTNAGILATTGVPEAATWDQVNYTVLPGTNVPNGTRQYFAIVNL